MGERALDLRPQEKRPEFSPRDPKAPAPSGRSRWLMGLGPLVLLALLVVAFIQFGPVGVFRGAFPPVEELTIERVTIPEPNELRVHVTNGGPEPVTIAQLLVDEASWVHEVYGGRTIPRLGSRTIRVPYPWVEGEPLAITIVTRNGVTFTADVPVATRTPAPNARYLSTFALLGIYAGVIPVFLGLLWLPFLRTISREWMGFFLSLTIGLLVFLGVDALFEGFEVAGLVPGAFNGLGLLLIGAVATPLAIAALGRWKGQRSGVQSAMWIAMLVAIGIGLHNLGEGLVIGAAYASGEIALGTFLVIGFLIHNTTEGLGIVAPIASERPSLGQLAMLGAIAGVPTVLGAWVGGFTYSPVWTTLFFAIGAGAIAQVVVELGRLLRRDGRPGLTAPLNVVGLVAGLAIMYVTGLVVPA